MHWKPLEERWWREEVRQGRLIRPRLDVYLNYWLTMRLAEEVPSHSVFAKFRGFADGGGRSIVDVVADIHHVAETFRVLDTFEPWSPEGTFLHRWRVMDAGVTTPVLLWLFSQESDRLSPDERSSLLRLLARSGHHQLHCGARFIRCQQGAGRQHPKSCSQVRELD